MPMRLEGNPRSLSTLSVVVAPVGLQTRIPGGESAAALTGLSDRPRISE